MHFEIEAHDKKRTSKFYSEAFGWKMEEQPEEYGEYIVVTTGDPKEPGGIFQNDKKQLNTYSCVNSVDYANKAVNDAKKAGGKVLVKIKLLTEKN